ncbi:MAG TPA: RDD family protein [Ferruginibacter sp.]|nr:RDD family protein [Ferruginibacter sp.]HNA16129.1 RDD family protein [Ferruginibacter sp.]HNF01837.1 RDD family protein [Ferruginibacter sp.]HNK28806.1 RDD family protein [Ferruginibacter sp.]HNL64100.1 RDD family protein [Ferruginibacter sp.]
MKLSHTDNPINAGLRLATMLLDHFCMTMIGILFFIPGIIADITKMLTPSHSQVTPGLLGGQWVYLGVVGLALYFCKDSFHGRSPAKRILKLQVVDEVTGEAASPMKCFVRNILCLLWPVEVIVALRNPARRLGDRLAGTRLVKFDPVREQPPIKPGALLLPLAIAYASILLFVKALPDVTTTRVDFSESSYNEKASNELQTVLADSLGTYFSPDVRIYDTIRNESLKYVSVILRLHKNYIEQDNSYRQLNKLTTELIYSKLPKESFRGQLQYFYKASGQVQGRTSQIGTSLWSAKER